MNFTDNFNHYSLFRKRYLTAYYRQIFSQRENTHMNFIFESAVTPVGFCASAAGSIGMIMKSKISLKKKVPYALFAVFLNAQVFLRRYDREYPFIPREEESFTTRLLECTVSPGFCLIKDALILKLLIIGSIPVNVFKELFKAASSSFFSYKISL